MDTFAFVIHPIAPKRDVAQVSVIGQNAAYAVDPSILVFLAAGLPFARYRRVLRSNRERDHGLGIGLPAHCSADSAIAAPVRL